ncbi:MAG TPA: hypothetical protein VI299_04565, partial [Polyangiales bacterium]
MIRDPELEPTKRSKKRRKQRRTQVDAPQNDGPPQPAWDETEDVEEDDEAGAQVIGSASDEEVISDPELESKAGTMSDDRTWGGFVPDTQKDEPASSHDAYDPLANTGVARLELIGQQGVDIRHEGDLEDAYESRLRFDA